jgi:DNA-directed RNA polymerase specialized sigma subunit
VRVEQELSMEQCRKILRQIAWRAQYRARKQQAKELLVYENWDGIHQDADVITDLFVQELLAQIPSSKGQYIIQRTLLDGFTEKEVAASLNMSQQGVSKWKKKGIQMLREHFDHS